MARTWAYTGKKEQKVEKLAGKGRLLQFKIILEGIKPDIWRRIQINDDTGMRTFAVAVILAMGLKNNHLHEFIIKNKHYGLTGEDYETFPEAMPLEDETKYVLKDFMREQLKNFIFLYDFGDGWKHAIEFEGEISAAKAPTLPVCTAGERNCPPEDCGGTGGYFDLLEMLKKTGTDECDSMIEWLGVKYDPEFFDLKIINRTLKKTDAYERYGFDRDENAGDIIFEDEYKNCGIGTAMVRKRKKE